MPNILAKVFRFDANKIELIFEKIHIKNTEYKKLIEIKYKIVNSNTFGLFNIKKIDFAFSGYSDQLEVDRNIATINDIYISNTDEEFVKTNTVSRETSIELDQTEINSFCCHFPNNDKNGGWAIGKFSIDATIKGLYFTKELVEIRKLKEYYISLQNN